MYSRPLEWSLPRDPKPLDQYSSLHLASQLINALIFDFVGLILDTEEPIYQSWAEVYAANGVPLPFEQWVKTVGSNNQEILTHHNLEERLCRPLTQEGIHRRTAR